MVETSSVFRMGPAQPCAADGNGEEFHRGRQEHGLDPNFFQIPCNTSEISGLLQDQAKIRRLATLQSYFYNLLLFYFYPQLASGCDF